MTFVRGNWLRKSHPSTAKHANQNVLIPPEALFCWTPADFEIFVAAWSHLGNGTVHMNSMDMQP